MRTRLAASGFSGQANGRHNQRTIFTTLFYRNLSEYRSPLA
jgi:hypothetical protein